VFGWFSAVSCSDRVCVAVGGYYDTSVKYRPMLAVSIDGGVTWTYPSTVTDPNTATPSIDPSYEPSESIPADLESITCHDERCIAVGKYQNTSSLSSPMIAVGTDFYALIGGVWTYPTTGTNPNLANPKIVPSFLSGHLNDVTCNSTTSICIAVGGYNTTDNESLALLGASNNDGATWVYPVTTLTNHEEFTHASCNETACLAVGVHSSLPSLAVGTNFNDSSGGDWYYPSEVNHAPSTTPSLSNGSFRGASASK
jgi:hypothetical protein